MDAARGHSAGIITQAEHDNIVAAQAARTEPPPQTGLGGLIEIHGMGSASDWTWGCIAGNNTVHPSTGTSKAETLRHPCGWPRDRSLVVPKPTHRKRGHAHPKQPTTTTASPVKWAELLKRVWILDALECARCKGRVSCTFFSPQRVSCT